MSIGFVDSFFSRKNRIRRICEPTRLRRTLLNLQWKIVSRHVRKIRRFRRCCFVSSCSGDRTPTHDCFRAQQSQRLPVVLSASEIRQILLELDGIDLRMTELLYGTGFRIPECCRLRTKDIDFERKQIIVREGKGDKDRAVPLPQ